MQVEDHGSLAPESGLGLEVAALHRLQRAAVRPTDLRRNDHGQVPGAPRVANLPAEPGERLLVWESARPAVVLPRHGDPDTWAHVPACAARGVPLLHRESGGGAVVVGPGCLGIALVLSLDRRPWLSDVERSYEWLLGGLAGVLAVGGIAIRSTDLAIRERKFAGHAQRRVRGALLHHGVVLYDFDLELVNALLPEPPRRPAWRRNRTHREFLTNAPLARAEIVRRLRSLPPALEQPTTWRRQTRREAPCLAPAPPLHDLAPQNFASLRSAAQAPSPSASRSPGAEPATPPTGGRGR